MMIGGQYVMSQLPNIEPVSLIVIAGTLVFGWRMLASVYVFVIAEGFIWGFGWWFWGYLYMWAILVAITMLFRKEEGRLTWAIISGFYGLLFGFLYEIPYIFIQNFRTALAWFLSGIPYDCIHAVGNFFIVFFVLQPLVTVLRKLRAGKIR